MKLKIQYVENVEESDGICYYTFHLNGDIISMFQIALPDHLGIENVKQPDYDDDRPIIRFLMTDEEHTAQNHDVFPYPNGVFENLGSEDVLLVKEISEAEFDMLKSFECTPIMTQVEISEEYDPYPFPNFIDDIEIEVGGTHYYLLRINRKQKLIAEFKVPKYGSIDDCVLEDLGEDLGEERVIMFPTFFFTPDDFKAVDYILDPSRCGISLDHLITKDTVKLNEITKTEFDGYKEAGELPIINIP